MPNEQRPPQHQDHQPGRRTEMSPRPEDSAHNYRGSGKLTGKVALVTGGDSGIGRSVAVAFAKEGADIALIYLEETEDAAETRYLIEEAGRRVELWPGDIADEAFCRSVVTQAQHRFGHIDILVNNAGMQFPEKRIEDIKPDNLHRTFATNVYGMFYLTQAAMPHLKEGAAIVNTASITAFQGNPILLDYSSTKGAIVSFTRSLAKGLVDKKIRVNAVAPGPVWTPLIPASFDAKQTAEFGSGNPMGRAAKADELAPAFVFLASNDSAFMTGQVLHVNGGEYFG